VRWISCRDAKEKAMRLMPSALAALIAGCLTLVSLERAIAQNYPTHPVRIIVSSAAGGPLDIVGRAVAEKWRRP
jgi:tripartite-type tricarboxylate transporter receptor subunit TctC